MLLFFFGALLLGCASADDAQWINVKSGVKGGRWGGRPQYNPGAPNNTYRQDDAYGGYVMRFNMTQHGSDGHNRSTDFREVGVCYIEVPTASLARDPAHIPAGNGSRPDLSRIRTCCKGYERNIELFMVCDPVCSPECVNGLCTAPNTCSCFPDHIRNLGGFCMPTCPIGCQNGHCSGGECLCKDGYTLDSEGKFCKPVCRENCGGIGNCTLPNTCECKQGYEAAPDGNCVTVCKTPCWNGCLINGECQCNQDYKKDYRGQCEPVCSQGCPLGQRCIATNVCADPAALRHHTVPPPLQRNNPLYPGNQVQNGTHPGHTYPGQTYPGQAYPGQAYPGQTYPGQTYPGQSYPGQTIPGQTYPGQTYPGQAVRGQSNPGQMYPGQRYPGQQYPDQPYPGQTYPGQTSPNETYPGQRYPGQTNPKQTNPGQQISGNEYTQDISRNQLNTDSQVSGQSETGERGDVEQTGYNSQFGNQNQSGYHRQNEYRGQSGYQGQTGYHGQSGYQSHVGSQGQSGYQGQTGYHEQSGYQGQVGSQGQSGHQGQSGYPGQYPGMRQQYPGQPDYQSQFGYPRYPGEQQPLNPDGLLGCPVACLNSICIEDTCRCNPGYITDPTDATRSRCIPNCPGGCPNGTCSAPHLCICNAGYRKDISVKGRTACVKRIRRSIDEQTPEDIASRLVFDIPEY